MFSHVHMKLYSLMQFVRVLHLISALRRENTFHMFIQYPKLTDLYLGMNCSRCRIVKRYSLVTHISTFCHWFFALNISQQIICGLLWFKPVPKWSQGSWHGLAAINYVDSAGVTLLASHYMYEIFSCQRNEYYRLLFHLTCIPPSLWFPSKAIALKLLRFVNYPEVFFNRFNIPLSTKDPHKAWPSSAGLTALNCLPMAHCVSSFSLDFQFVR